ncbi:sodium/glutamate symporter [Litorilituus lipolyticus]|uniref:Sodium/glutamate symporter n=1 Tax=Litorilituus lipolyticus TaxID=2491017 RepID=A0A502L7L2_9GAMM|nr:sodium/glutamate symporter [Litorilituus lipolyticus]TPH18093.1 sodium/glutamate symporter [Litorilituus lipolyticus]
MEFDSRQTVIIAIIVLLIGKLLKKRVNFFQKYNIPEPVIGGILASLVFSSFYFAFESVISFSLEQRDALLVVFFTCVGLSAKLSTLMKGGKSLVILLAIATIFLIFQNITGIGIAWLTGLSDKVGVLGGSVSLSGGHGTAIAWAPVFVEKYGISNAVEIGIACATFGLVLGGVSGGPIFNYLSKKHHLKSQQEEVNIVGFSQEEKAKITVDTAYNVLLAVCIAIGIGLSLHELSLELGFKLPIFVPCLFGGIILTNTVPYLWKSVPWASGKPTLALLSDFSLGLFLAMSLMSLQLWTLIDLALPILLLLASQVLLAAFFAIFVVFIVLGKNYDAAVMASGYVGLGLGATPTAVANMTAVTQKCGPSTQAFIVIPLIGAFFIDIANAIIIQFFLS